MEQCGFFDANLVGEDYDRVYLASHFAAYFASFIGNGVFGGKSDELQVVALQELAMQVVVSGGQGWINGYWYENTSDLYLPVEVADGILNRIDTVVLRLGFAERTMWLAVKKGTPATEPIAPEPLRNTDYYELQLATINIPAGCVKITQAQITDTRMKTDVCGWVTSTVEHIDTTTLYLQVQTALKEFEEKEQADFLAWYESVKDIITEDSVVQLQNQIDTIVGSLLDNLDAVVANTKSNQYAGANAVKELNAKLGGLRFVAMTQSQYEALPSKDPNTIYFTTD